MNRPNDPARNRSRREALGLLGMSAALLGTAALSRHALAADDEVLSEALTPFTLKIGIDYAPAYRAPPQ